MRNNKLSYNNISGRSGTRIAALCLFFALLFSLCSCGGSADRSAVVMKYGESAITENMYKYWLCSYKGSILYNYDDANDTDEFWSELIDGKMTAEKYFNSVAEDNAKTFLVCMELFNQYALEIPDSYYTTLDQYISDMIDTYADGKKNDMNGILAEYGVNLRLLKNILLQEYKQTMVFEHLYGESGITPITDEQRNKYYTGAYSRVHQIYINNKYEYVYDENGDYVYDSDGNIKRTVLDDEAVREKESIINEIQTKLDAGADFVELRNKYTEEKRDDEGNVSYPNGYYLTADMASDFIYEVVKAARTIKPGEVLRVESEYGVHFLYGVELDEKAYENKENADFFEDFEENTKNSVFMDTVKQYAANIVIDDELLSKFTIRSVTPNYSF